MKKTWKILTVAAFMLCAVMLLTACGSIGESEAQRQATKFLEAAAEGDFDKAESYLHPANDTDVEAYFKMFQDELSIKFENVTVDKFTFLSSAAYDSEVDGSLYELEAHTLVGEGEEADEIEFIVTLVRNDDGFGIYSFKLKPQKNFGIKLN